MALDLLVDIATRLSQRCPHITSQLQPIDVVVARDYVHNLHALIEAPLLYMYFIIRIQAYVYMERWLQQVAGTVCFAFAGEVTY